MTQILSRVKQQIFLSPNFYGPGIQEQLSCVELILGLPWGCSHAVNQTAAFWWAGWFTSKLIHVDVGRKSYFFTMWAPSQEGHDLAAGHTKQVI